MAIVGIAPLNAAQAETPYTIDAGTLAITLNDSGIITSLQDTATDKEYASATHPEPLVKLVANGAEALPTAVSYDAPTSTYDFTFGGISNSHVMVEVVSETAYSTLEVTDVTEGSGVDISILMWGPVTTSITKTVGESAGVVYDDNFAIGIHPLNHKTVGGWVNEFDDLSYNEPNVNPINDWRALFHWRSASHTSWGSILQAYTFDHSQARTRGSGEAGMSTWMPNHPMPALPGSDGQITGSKIALFGAATADVPSTLENIQIGEDLAHPTVGGQWGKTAQASRASMLMLTDLKTTNVATAAQAAKDAGLDYIYYWRTGQGPYVSNGHLAFNSDFGSSDAAAKSLVDTAATYGIKVGVHSLADFIDYNDPYATPTPSANLGKGGSAKLTQALTSTSTDIFVDNDAPFTSGLGKHLQIDNELVAWDTITQVGSTNEWKIHLNALDRRGMWATTPAAHSVDGTVSRLIQNQYGGAVGGLPIIDEIATRMSTMFNTTGIKTMGWDGLESAAQIGYGTYPMSVLTNDMYDGLTNGGDFITESSRITPNTWDVLTRVSWGGDVGSGDNMTAHYVNAAYTERNFLPVMMGWFPVTNDPVFMEYQLSKMASWNSGIGFQSSVTALNGMSNKTAVLDAIKQWETARNLGAFTPRQRAKMRDVNTHWHLSVVTAGSKWKLQESTSTGTLFGPIEDVFVGNTNEVNLAYNKTASQSSTAYGGSASLAVDGTVDGDWSHGSVTHTSNNANAWWQVDLGKSTLVSSVNVFNRTDNAPTVPARLTDYYVFVSDSPFNTSLTPAVQATQPGVTSSHQTGQAGSPSTIQLPGGTRGKYVMVQLANTNYLSIAEVQVFGPTNLADHGTATQATTLFGAGADRAVDGNTDGNYYNGSTSHTDTALNSWWQVDLGKSKPLSSISVFNRSDNAPTVPARLTDFYLFVSDSPFNTSLTPVAQAAEPGVWSSHQTGQAGRPTTIQLPAGGRGRHVMVQLAGTNYLAISEVQVFERSNVAANKGATQSSTAYGGSASRAVDGNVDGDWYNGSVTHTASNANAWWQVDLGGSKPLTSINVYNRTDNAPTVPARLTDFYVFVSDSPFNTSLTPAAQATQPGVTASHQTGQAGSPTNIQLPANTTGRYVMVQLAGTNFLSIAEVEAFTD